MVDELKKCISALFRLKGKDVMNEKEFVYTASMDLHWFSPRDSQRLLDISLKNDFLKMSQGLLAPTFELSEIEMETDYKPADSILKSSSNEEKKDIFMELVNKISESSKLQRKEIVARANKVRERFPVNIEVAVLMVARDLGIDIEEDIETVRNNIQNSM